MLRPLVISTNYLGSDQGAPTGASQVTCHYCGGDIGLHAGSGGDCALCVVVRHIDRPRIDEEARLTWLPEMSQAALICLVHEMHRQLRTGGERFDGEGGPTVLTAERSALHYARQSLSTRSSTVAEYLGTARPSELSQVLGRLSAPSYAQRHKLLGGLRVLPVGRFFIESEDVYPAIVDDRLMRTNSKTTARSAA
jgi:intracellular multiplication protein IcmJ